MQILAGEASFGMYQWKKIAVCRWTYPDLWSRTSGSLSSCHGPQHVVAYTHLRLRTFSTRALLTMYTFSLSGPLRKVYESVGMAKVESDDHEQNNQTTIPKRLKKSYSEQAFITSTKFLRNGGRIAQMICHQLSTSLSHPTALIDLSDISYYSVLRGPRSFWSNTTP